MLKEGMVLEFTFGEIDPITLHEENQYTKKELILEIKNGYATMYRLNNGSTYKVSLDFLEKYVRCRIARIIEERA